MSEFNFNAPQYIDFSQPNALDLQEIGEDYFDLVTDADTQVEYSEITIDDDYPSPEIPLHNGQSANSSISNDIQSEIIEPETVEKRTKFRRSLSTGHIELISNRRNKSTCSNISHLMNKLKVSEETKSTFSSRYRAGSDGRLTQKSRSKSQSRDTLNKTSQDSLQSNKYISLAEAIQKFHFKTPQRFHTTSSKQTFGVDKCTNQVTYTIPQSPMLSTKSRARQTIYKSREALEEEEREQMKKHQIKANPINYNIFRTPILNIKKRRNTEIQPFKFTEVQYNKNVPSPKKEVYEFHARPAPKFTHNPTQPIIKRTIKPATLPKTPTFMRKWKVEHMPAVCENSISNLPTIKKVEINHEGLHKKIELPTKTQLRPFSFEERNKQMLMKKEEKIRKILEEEKKWREFHARPILSKVATGCQKIESKVGKLISDKSYISLASSNDENSEPNCNNKRFKARPATVLQKKPFVPVKLEHPAPEATGFNLHSERRGKEREQYDKGLKEKEAEIDYFRKLHDENLKKKQEQEIAILRKQSVHKATSVRHYKHVDIQPSTKKLTSPQSPLFKSKTLKRSNDE